MDQTHHTQADQTSPTQALIKRLRARSLSQTEISRRTGISQPKLSRWEAGETAAGADDALRLKALEDELLHADTAPTPVVQDVATKR